MKLQMKSDVCLYCCKKFSCISTTTGINGCYIYNTLQENLNDEFKEEKRQEILNKLKLVEKWFIKK